MNTIWTSLDAVPFLERFYQFYDALVWKIDVEMGSSRQSRCASIVVGTRDQSQTGDSEWVNVRMCFKDVSEFCINEEANSQIQVLSDGIRIVQFGQSLIVDFDPYTDVPEGIEDIRRSHLYFACVSIEWEVSEYDEHPN